MEHATAAPEAEIRTDRDWVRNRAGVGDELGGGGSDDAVSRACISRSASTGKARPSPPIGPSCRSADGRPLPPPPAGGAAATPGGDLPGCLSASRHCPLAWRVWSTTFRLRTSLIWIRQSTTWEEGRGGGGASQLDQDLGKDLIGQ